MASGPVATCDVRPPVRRTFPGSKVRAGCINGPPPAQPVRHTAQIADTRHALARRSLARTLGILLFAEAGREIVRGRLRLENLIIRMETNRALEQHRLRFKMPRVRKAAFDGTYCLAGLVIVKPHTLGAKLGIDHIDLVAFADGFVRALWLARATVDAIGSDVGRHIGLDAINEVAVGRKRGLVTAYR